MCRQRRQQCSAAKHANFSPATTLNAPAHAVAPGRAALQRLCYSCSCARLPPLLALRRSAHRHALTAVAAVIQAAAPLHALAWRRALPLAPGASLLGLLWMLLLPPLLLLKVLLLLWLPLPLPPAMLLVVNCFILTAGDNAAARALELAASQLDGRGAARRGGNACCRDARHQVLLPQAGQRVSPLACGRGATLSSRMMLHVARHAQQGTRRAQLRRGCELLRSRCRGTLLQGMWPPAWRCGALPARPVS